ncbi:hypothetical protein H6P81_009375 [Aristolochia fimbriata]|uniref:Uncharacterized protein n=1 Tax=Aristolochia fimbriata TaxID=158543 RepID=A0AAV7EMS0_ARIFI|nr:hypothetical protein H6P81_009375 [Aristolochia fimbriata]
MPTKEPHFKDEKSCGKCPCVQANKRQNLTYCVRVCLSTASTGPRMNCRRGRANVCDKEEAQSVKLKRARSVSSTKELRSLDLRRASTLRGNLKESEIITGPGRVRGTRSGRPRQGREGPLLAVNRYRPLHHRR